MRHLQLKSLGPLLTVAALLCSVSAHAQLIINLNPLTQPVIPGSEIIFSGSLSNAQYSELSLDSISFNFAADPAGTYFTSPPAALDPFFDGSVPFSLLNTTDVYTGDLFGLQVDPTTPPGFYDGTATITSHYDGQAAFTTDQDVQFTVSPASSAAVPESDTLSLFGIGMAALGCAVLRRRSRPLRDMSI